MADPEELSCWLVEHVLHRDQQPEHLRAAVFERCRALRVEPPTEGRVDRLIASAARAHEDRFCRSVLDRLPAESLERMDALLDPEDSEPLPQQGGASDRGHSFLHELKADPGRIGLDSVLEELRAMTSRTCPRRCQRQEQVAWRPLVCP